MKQGLFVGTTGIFFIALALNACSTAAPRISEWRNPAHSSSSYQRLLIGGPRGETTQRRNFEDEFAAQLMTAGVDALPSYRYLAENEPIDETSLKQAAQKARADGFLLIRPVKVEEKTNYPPLGPEISFGIFGSNVGAGWTGIPGATGPYRYNEYTSEAALYDLARSDVVWTATVTTSAQPNVPSAIRTYAETITKALARQNLISKK